MSNLELVDFLSRDKLRLPGLLYSPSTRSKKVAIWLHGMGDNGIFYNPLRLNALGKSLNEKNISLLAFNNRGAHNSKLLHIENETLPEDDRIFQGGTNFDKIADCLLDIDGALDYLEKSGYDEFYLMGHSTGANKVCAYHSLKKNSPFRKYVLASPGDDVGLYYTDLGKQKFWKALNYAKSKVKSGQHMDVMRESSGLYPLSTQSTANFLDPEGDNNSFPFFEATTERIGRKPLFCEYRTIDIPTLVVLGEQDRYLDIAKGANNALKILKDFMPKNIRKVSTFKILSGSDHGFHGNETEFAETISLWIAT